jgi:integrase
MSIVPRARRDGSVGYQVRVSIGGRRLPAETFTTRREARRREAELIATRRRATSDETCDHFADRWLDDYPTVKSGPTRGRPRSQRTRNSYTERLRPFVREFRGVPLADVDRVRSVAFAREHPRAAEVARGMFQDAMDTGLIDVNPFSRMNIAGSSGRRDHAPLTVEELHRLADLSIDVHGPEYGPVLRAMILFTGYVGPRIEECCALESSWIDFGESEVSLLKAKFDKPRTVLLLPEAAEALRSMPRRAGDECRQVFRTKRGLPIRSRSAHYWSWNPVRAAFWATLSEQRRREIDDLDWHSLRHFCGWYFYVELGHSDELTAYQLGHADAKLIRNLYGHGKADALERLKRGVGANVVPLRSTSLPRAAGDRA